MNDTQQTDRSGRKDTGKYPQSAGIQLAAQDGSERYYFRSPVGGISSIPAMNAKQAAEILADDLHGFGPDDFEEVDGFGAKAWDYPDPVESGRDVNEHDLYLLPAATAQGSRVGLSGKYRPRKNPTKHTIDLLLAEWDDPADVPLHDFEGLQEATGIGPDRAGQVIGAAVANRLIERPIRHG